LEFKSTPAAARYGRPRTARLPIGGVAALRRRSWAPRVWLLGLLLSAVQHAYSRAT